MEGEALDITFDPKFVTTIDEPYPGKYNPCRRFKIVENILIQHIEITPGVRGGKPRLAGSRITVTDIVMMHLKLGQSVDEIATEYNLPLAGIYAALAYYYDHQAEIDRQMAEDEAFAAAFQQQNPSKLQAKLRQLRGE
jgi:uncharacterized protein (DUF433 family)